MSEGAGGTARRGAGLRRELGVLALTAGAVCTVIGGGINVVCVEIQDKVPGLGNLVPWIFVIGAVPAVFTALAYAALASAMPAAGGGYIYASRGFHPLVGFMATFSKWFGLTSACGVIAYVDVTLLKAAALYANLQPAAQFLETDLARLGLPLLMIWVFWLINIVGIRTYGFTVILLMFLMMLGGVVVIFTGFMHSPEDYAAAVAQRSGGAESVFDVAARFTGGPVGLGEIAAAMVMLFFAYIGFASISQAGGEARDPQRSMPRAFVLAIIIIVGYYVLFSAAVYHAVPWQYIAVRAQESAQEVSVPELLGVLMPGWLAVFVALMAAVALANDIPPMLMAVSRLFFSWTRDGIFPRALSEVNRRFATPHWALTISAALSTFVIVECHFHGFFLGIDTTVTALLFTYLLVAAALLTLPRRNPHIYQNVAFLRSRPAQIFVGITAVLTVGAMFTVQIVRDIRGLVAGEVSPSHSPTVFWAITMLVGAIIFSVMWYSQKARGIDPEEPFRTVPQDSEPEGMVI